MRDPTVADVVNDVARRLAAVAPDEPLREAESLMAAALGWTRAQVRSRSERPVDRDALARIDEWTRRRAAGEPLAYLTGEREFWSLSLAVDPRVLVPRPDTERLVELALERLPADRPARVLELATGSGAVAIAIARERPLATVIATDVDPAALDVAQGNGARLASGRIDWRLGSWWAPVAGERFDAIVANPPYLATDDPHLPALAHEPAGALVSGPTGLEAIEAIAAGAPGHLADGGWLLLEHGADQGPAARRCLAAAGLADIATATDLAGLDRVTFGRRPS